VKALARVCHTSVYLLRDQIAGSARHCYDLESCAAAMKASGEEEPSTWGV
jgi:hypothetical protein